MEIKKHAYLIIAHDEWEMLKTLVECLDDNRNDIFIHVDKKVDGGVYKSATACCTQAGVYFIDNQKRINVRWGDYSQIMCELTLFEESRAHGDYAYYHLLSGHDLPIKSQDYIHKFFEDIPNGANLVGTATSDFNIQDCWKKTKYYCIFPKYQRCSPASLQKTFSALRKVSYCIQRLFCIHRKWGNIQPYKGVNWVSITSDFVDYILSKKEYIEHQFKYVSCGDEIFIQTLIHNSDFKSTLYQPIEDFGGCMREIDWERGKPYVFTVEDFEMLKKSEMLFARKFSYKVDADIIREICNYIK